jgi:phosphatidylglycerol---prolipoprotein diacylglyceryl transferase
LNFPITLFGIHLHQLFEVLAYALGYRYYLYLRKTNTDLIADNARLWIFIGAALGGFWGSHILGILEKPNFIQQLSLLVFMSNKTIVGGLLGGLVGVEIIKKFLKVKTSSGDLMTYPLILAIAIGRIGCFAEGLEDGTFGNITTLPWGINFGDGLFRHPTQLYEIAFLLILWLCIYKIEKTFKLKNGNKFKFFMISYLVFRFIIEYLKPNIFWGNIFCSIQIACIFGLLYYISIAAYHSLKKAFI